MNILMRLFLFTLSIILFSGCSKTSEVETPAERFFDFHGYTMNLLTGEKQNFELRDNMTNYPFSEIRFESLDITKVKILNDRTIQSLSPGTTAVKAMLGNRELDRFTVVVIDGVVTAISLLPAMTKLKKGQYFQLDPVVTPLVAKDRSVFWSSSDSTVAQVDQKAKVSAVRAGSAIITGVTATNLSVKCIVEVVQ